MFYLLLSLVDVLIVVGMVALLMDDFTTCTVSFVCVLVVFFGMAMYDSLSPNINTYIGDGVVVGVDVRQSMSTVLVGENTYQCIPVIDSGAHVRVFKRTSALGNVHWFCVPNISKE